MTIENYYKLLLDPYNKLSLINPDNLEVLNSVLSNITYVSENKKDSIALNSEFINGYYILCDHKFMNLNGEIYESDVKIVSDFSCDRAIILFDFLSERYGFIDETGKIIYRGYGPVMPFSCSLASITMNNADETRYKTFIKKDGTLASNNKYKHTSMFKDGYADVLDFDDKWKRINTEFEVVKVYTEEEYDKVISNKKMLDDIKGLYEQNNIEIYMYDIKTDGNSKTYKFNAVYEDTRLGLRVENFVNTMIKNFNLKLQATTLKERFAETVEKISALGLYLVNTDTFEVYPAQIKNDEIFFEVGNCLITGFNEKEKEMVRKRVD